MTLEEYFLKDYLELKDEKKRIESDLKSERESYDELLEYAKQLKDLIGLMNPTQKDGYVYFEGKLVFSDDPLYGFAQRFIGKKEEK